MNIFVVLTIVFFESIFGAVAVWFYGKYHDKSANN